MAFCARVLGIDCWASFIIGLTLYDYFLSRSGLILEKVLITSLSALITSFISGTILWFFNERH